MAISSRYIADGKSVLPLSSLQAEARDTVTQNIHSVYDWHDKTSCALCDDVDFDFLSEKDRYGIPHKMAICRSCGLVQANPKLSEESYKSFYSDFYRSLHTGSALADEDFFKQQMVHGERIVEFAKECGVTIAEKSVFEVGCGAGGILKSFSDAGACRVAGVDLSEGYVNYGRDVHGLNLWISSVEELEVSEKFDLIVLSHVLEHFVDPVAVLRKLRDCLNSGGCIYIEVPGLKYLRYSYEMDLLRLLQLAHVYNFSYATLGGVLGKSGFRMLNGDESIRCIARSSNDSDGGVELAGEYVGVMEYLKKLERYRRLISIIPRPAMNFIKTKIVKPLRNLGMFGRQFGHN